MISYFSEQRREFQLVLNIYINGRFITLKINLSRTIIDTHISEATKEFKNLSARYSKKDYP